MQSRASPRPSLNWPQFLRSHILQTYQPSTPHETKTLFSLQKQQTLSNSSSSVSIKPMQPQQTKFYYQKMARYILGGAFMEDTVLQEMNRVLSPLVSEVDIGRHPEALLPVLHRTGFMVSEHDNLYRVLANSLGRLRFSDRAMELAKECQFVVDPFDVIREDITRPVYAIDSIKTSEVDDAIGMFTDSEGKEWIDVYVADVTAYCPLDSELARVTGGKLATTTYLPEGVFFMLPKPLVQAATLDPDRPCRAFHARFRIDHETGNVVDYHVGVSRIQTLRRVTYDVVQDIISGNSPSVPASAPAWMTLNDVENILKMNSIRLIRRAHRMQNGAWKLLSPKPSITINNETDVNNNKHTIRIKIKTDEVIHLQDAYNLVEEFMLAGNEVCARVGVERNVGIPFRITRPLSNRHGDIDTTTVPTGTTFKHQHRAAAPAAPSGHLDIVSLSRSISEDNLSLRGTTRAYYSHIHGEHSFLATVYYCHATSPLRRYADMMVHHQLKSLLATDNNLAKGGHLVRMDTVQLKHECATTSKKSNDARILMKQSVEFWALQYILQNKVTFLHAVICSHYSTKSSPLMAYSQHSYASRIVLSQLLVTATLYHSNHNVSEGDVVKVKVVEVTPVRLVLRLELVEVIASTHPEHNDIVSTFSKSLKEETGDI